MHQAGDRNHRVLLKRRPGDEPTPEDFASDTTAVPTPGPGQLLSRTLYLSPDADFGLTTQSELLSPRQLNPGDVVGGETVAQVLESRHPEYRSGEYIVVPNGWQQFALSSGQGVRRLNPAKAPISTALGVLGIPGLAGYVGLVYSGEPRPGQTVLVSAATDSTGCTAGQTARLIGAHAVGIVSSDEERDYAVTELRYSACLRGTGTELESQIKQACPRGVDVLFDNVGGALLTSVLKFLAPRARVVLCGGSATYRVELAQPTAFLEPFLHARATLQGIAVSDHLDRLPELERVVGGWIRSGAFRYREEIVDGLASAPELFCRLARGEIAGQALVRVAPEHL